MKSPRILFAVACLVLAAVIGGVTLLNLNTAHSLDPRAISTGKALIGGPFQLVDQNGKAVDQGLLKGKWSAVFFGYTFCPDVCPTTLQTLAAAQDKLGTKAKDLQVVFVSIDPARDTPKQLKAYLSSKDFPAGTIGLTGTNAQVAAAAKVYRIYYAKHGSGSDYTMDHSSVTYLMDPKGEFVAALPYNLSPDQEADQIRSAMEKSS
ncbi:MAG TPA: SCO family protein [Caulobacteraceae bacterium]|nr:SCO family protein [Caulobacteraceae bacterium]